MIGGKCDEGGEERLWGGRILPTRRRRFQHA